MDRRAVDAPLRRHHLLEDQRILLLQDLVALQIQRGVHIVVYQPSQDFKNGGCMELDPLEVRWASGATANPEAGTSPQEKQDGKNPGASWAISSTATGDSSPFAPSLPWRAALILLLTAVDGRFCSKCALVIRIDRLGWLHFQSV
jgi:hypothetical protein